MPFACPSADDPKTANLWEDPIIDPITIYPVSHIKGEPESSVDLPPHHYPARSCTYLLTDTSNDEEYVPLLTRKSLFLESQHRYELHLLSPREHDINEWPQAKMNPINYNLSHEELGEPDQKLHMMKIPTLSQSSSLTNNNKWHIATLNHEPAEDFTEPNLT